jgi:hypothetical protein
VTRERWGALGKYTLMVVGLALAVGLGTGLLIIVLDVLLTAGPQGGGGEHY